MRKPKYPEMVMYFARKFNPRKESILDFVSKAKPGHTEFLLKRGWDPERIDAVWNTIINSLSARKTILTLQKRRWAIVRDGKRWRIVRR